MPIKSYTIQPKVQYFDTLYVFCEYPIPKPWVLIWSWSPYAAITPSPHQQRLLTRFWNIVVLICAHSTTRALGKSGIDVTGEGLVCSWCSVWLRSGLCSSYFSSSTPAVIVFMDLTFCAQEHCLATGLGQAPQFQLNLNITAHTNILNNCNSNRILCFVCYVLLCLVGLVQLVCQYLTLQYNSKPLHSNDLQN